MTKSRFIRFSCGVLSVVILLLLSSSFVPRADFSQMSATSNTLMEGVLARLSALSGSAVNFSLRSLRQLKNTQGQDAYALLELNPYGYAVVLNDNGMLLEACLTEDSVSPLTEVNETEYYYVGPSQLAYETDQGLVLKQSNTLLTENSLQSVCRFEDNLQEILISSAGTNDVEQSVVAAPPAHQSYIKTVGGTYFPSLNNLGDNRFGTCVVIAATMLFGYYDANVHPAYVDATYTAEATSSSSAGTTEAFHQLLCNYVYGHPVTGGSNGTSIGNALSGFNSYLRDRALPVSLCFADDTIYSAHGFYNVIAGMLESDHPVIASFNQPNSDGSRLDHCVAVYGYSYVVLGGGAELNSATASLPDIDYSTLMFKAHSGWLNSSQSDRERWVSAIWFHQCAYIPDCDATGTHYSAVKKYIFGDYHSGNLHYYKRQLACCSCGVNTGTDWEALPCDGNCVGMMSTREAS